MNSRPGPGQQGMWDAPADAAAMRINGGGRHSAAMAGAVAAAEDAGHLSELDRGLATVLMAGAWELDMHESRMESWGPSKVMGAMVDALREAHMTPDSRGNDTDDKIAALITEMSTAQDTAPVHIND